MYSQILALSDELQKQKSLANYSLPIELVTVMTDQDSSELAKFVLTVARNRINFELIEFVDCTTPDAAWKQLKQEDGLAQRIYYTLKFLSLYSKATSKTADSLLQKIMYG